MIEVIAVGYSNTFSEIYTPEKNKDLWVVWQTDGVSLVGDHYTLSNSWYRN